MVQTTTQERTEHEKFKLQAIERASGADAVGLVALEGGETTGYVYVSDEYPADERRRLRHEAFKSLVHQVGKRLNPLALLMAGGPPEPRRDQPSLDACDDDPSDAIEAIERSDAFVIACVEHDGVEWGRSEGASYGGGLGAVDKDRDAAERVLDAALEFSADTTREEIMRG